jgi:hypothetical protein
VLTIHLRLEGASLAVPVTVHPLLDARPLGSTQSIADGRFALGNLTLPDSEEGESTFSAALHAAYQDDELDVAVVLPADAPPGSVLQLGLAVEGADTHAEVQIETPAQHPKLLPARGTTPNQVAAWRCRVLQAEDPPALFCVVTIPARALDIPRLEPETRFLLAARYVEPQPGGRTAPLVLEWGHGLGGEQCTAAYRWVRLRPADAD